MSRIQRTLAPVGERRGEIAHRGRGQRVSLAPACARVGGIPGATGPALIGTAGGDRLRLV